MRHMTKMLCLVVLGLSLASTTGCTRVTAGQIRANMTPELASTNRSRELRKNDLARVRDNNTRAIWDDMDRFLLLHRNSRLTPWPVP
jgi:hypothetical protein